MQKKFHISSFLPIGRLTVCINKLSDSFQPTTFCHILQHPTANSNLGIVALKNFSIFAPSPLSLSLFHFLLQSLCLFLPTSIVSSFLSLFIFLTNSSSFSLCLSLSYFHFLSVVSFLFSLSLFLSFIWHLCVSHSPPTHRSQSIWCWHLIYDKNELSLIRRSFGMHHQCTSFWMNCMTFDHESASSWGVSVLLLNTARCLIFFVMKH